MTWEEIKQLPDDEFLAAMVGRRFRYGKLSRCFEIRDTLNSYTLHHLYYSQVLKTDKEEYEGTLEGGEGTGLSLVAFVAWERVVIKIDRDEIHLLLPEEKGEEI